MSTRCLFFLIMPVSIFGFTASAFDIGTGKIKMQVVEIEPNQKVIQSLYCCALKNSEGLSEGAITLEDQKKLLFLLLSLKQKAADFKVVRSIGIVTEFMRKIDNGLETIAFLAKESQIDLRLISREEEGILAHQTIVYEGKLDSDKTIVWDLGSGSFQVTYKEEDRYFVISSSLNQSLIQKLALTVSDKELIQEVKNKIHFFPPENVHLFKEKILKAGGKVVGIGKHPRFIGGDKPSYTLDNLCEEMAEDPERDIDRSGILRSYCVMEMLNIKEVICQGSISGNTTGLIIQMLEESEYEFDEPSGERLNF